MVDIYIEKWEKEREFKNLEAWLNGVYTHQAMTIVMNNAFRKKNDIVQDYPHKPLDLFIKSEEELVKKQSERLYNQMKNVVHHVNHSRSSRSVSELLKEMETVVGPDGKKIKNLK